MNGLQLTNVLLATLALVALLGGWLALRRATGTRRTTGLPSGRAMHLSPCSGIHTFGMKFTLDLVFLDRDLSVTRIVQGVKPWRMAAGGRGAHSVLEMEAGWLGEEEVRVGDQLELIANIE